MRRRSVGSKEPPFSWREVTPSHAAADEFHRKVLAATAQLEAVVRADNHAADAADREDARLVELAEEALGRLARACVGVEDEGGRQRGRREERVE